MAGRRAMNWKRFFPTLVTVFVAVTVPGFVLHARLLAPVLSQVVQRPAQASKDEQELRRLENELLGAYLRGNKATFDRIAADDFTSTDESAKVRSKAEEREIIQAPPDSIKVSLTNEEVKVRIYGDTAILIGRIVAKTQPGGQAEISFQSRFTDTLLKRQGRWQIVARHYSRLPPGRTAVKLDPKVYDAYIGQYELAPNFVLAVTKEGDKLMSQASGQPKFELLPESEIGFFMKDFSALFIFMRGETGEVNQLITVQDGRIIIAKRIK
jgi:ketosteroid isomerase-like protein